MFTLPTKETVTLIRKILIDYYIISILQAQKIET